MEEKVESVKGKYAYNAVADVRYTWLAALTMPQAKNVVPC